MIDCRSAVSSARGSGTYRTTDRATPSALQTRRSECACFIRTRATASRQRAGLSSSRGDFLQDELVDRQSRHRALEPRVLRCELSQALRLIDPQAAMALTPAEVRLICYPKLPARLRDRLALRKQHLRLAQPVDDLLR